MESAVERIYSPGYLPLDWHEPDDLAIKLTSSFPGLPVVQTLTPWEALVWAIIGQQINVAFAHRVKRAFAESFGPRVHFKGTDYIGFPSPQATVDLDHDRDLRPLQFSRQKSRYVIEAARSVLSGTLDLDAIWHIEDDEALDVLQRQIGIGRWTAEYILLRGYHRVDVIPAGDAALKDITGRHLSLGRSATESEVRELAENWRPRRGEIGFLLWFARQSGWFRD